MKWEYLVITKPRKGIFGKKKELEGAQELNVLGNEGWELVGVMTVVSSGYTTDAMLFFKREVSK